MTRQSRCILILSLFTFVGCSRDSSTLQGTASFDGKPITNGMVAVRSDDGKIRSGTIQANGSYTVYDVPLGSVQIMVKTYPPSLDVLPPEAKTEGKLPVTPAYVTLPDRYGDFATSKLATTIVPGDNKYDLNLEK